MDLTETQQLMLGKVGPRVKYSVANKTDIPKILLIKLGAVGDLVLVSPFFDQLRKHFPHSEIVLVVGRSSHGAIENNPNIDRIICADDYVLYHGSLLVRLLEFFRLILKIRKEEFDLAFILHRAWPFNLLVYLMGIQVRIGFDCGYKGMFLTHPALVNDAQNERESYLDLLRIINIPSVYKGTYFYLSDEEKDFLGLYLERHDIGSDEELIAIAPGGGDNAKSIMATKRWPVENYIALNQKFQNDRPCRVILFGGPTDRRIAKKIIKSCPDCLDATDLSFGDMASIFRRCSIFVGNDSAPNHIAASMGLPCVGIWGPTDPRQWAPLEAYSRIVINKVECHPCFLNGKFPPCSHMKCMSSITVDDVWNNVVSVLEQNPVQVAQS